MRGKHDFNTLIKPNCTWLPNEVIKIGKELNDVLVSRAVGRSNEGHMVSGDKSGT